MRLTRAAHNIEALARLDSAIVELSLLAIDQDQWEPARQHAGAAFDAIDDLLDLLLAFRPATEQAAVMQQTYAFTTAELRILPFLHTHLTYNEIAKRMYLSRNTVNSQVRSIFRKLGVQSRSDAVTTLTALGVANSNENAHHLPTAPPEYSQVPGGSTPHRPAA